MAKTIFITGCQSGIGHAAARYFSEQGWNVAATMLFPEEEHTLPHLNNVEVYQLDVEDRQSIQAAVQSSMERFGQIDVLLNNAGFAVMGIFEAATDEQIRKQFSVNLFGAWDVIRALLPHFRAKRAGMIINVSSSAGRFSWPLLSLYNATKCAMEGFSETLFYELEPFNIGVKVIEPHKIKTSFGSGVMSAGLGHDLKDYEAYATTVLNTMAEWGNEDDLETPESVARVIYDAATDGTRQFRYLIGKELIEMVKLKCELSDEAFMNLVSSKFKP